MNSLALLTFFTIVGVGFCMFYVAKLNGIELNKVQFSLRSIFILITAMCIIVASFVSFGTDVLAVLGVLMLWLMPAANFVLVAGLCVSVIHERDEPQAIAIGRLVPMVGLVVVETIRIAAWLLVQQSVAAWIYFLVAVSAYITALVSGYVAREVFRTLKRPAAVEAELGTFAGDRKLPSTAN